MKKITLFVLLITLLAGVAHSKKIGTLDGIFKPQMINAFDNEIFIVEGNNFYIFSADELKLKRKIGREGEGPGEFKLDPLTHCHYCHIPRLYNRREPEQNRLFLAKRGLH
ncbi:MAG: hypothetical protein GY757_07235 [bacterium]|nr:hypothetical protein [bacterium]